MKSVPADFCWKKGADVGYIPKNCPSGSKSNGMGCTYKCKSGYSYRHGWC